MKNATRAPPQPKPTLEGFLADAKTFVDPADANAKLTAKERAKLGSEFRGLARDDKLAAIDSLKKSSPVLAKFAENQRVPREAREPKEPKEPREKPSEILEALDLDKSQVQRVTNDHRQYEQLLRKKAPLAERLDLYAFAERGIAVDNDLAPQLNDLARFNLTPGNERKIIDSYRKYLEGVHDPLKHPEGAPDHDSLEKFARSILFGPRPPGKTPPSKEPPAGPTWPTDPGPTDPGPTDPGPTDDDDDDDE